MPKIKVSDIEMNYEVEGEGEPLLILSGWVKITASAERFRRIFGSSYRMIRPEHRGMGQTDAPDAPYAIEMLAADLNGLLERLDLRQVRLLGGGGMGAQVAIVLASRHPDKVRSLMLGAPIVKVDPFARELLRFWCDLYRVSPQLWARDISLHEYAAKTWNDRPEVIHKAITARIADNPFGTPAVYEKLTAAYIAFDASDFLPRIACPTLVTCGGAEDRITGPRYAKEVHSRIPGATLHVFEDAAHGYQTEAFEQFSQVARDWFART